MSVALMISNPVNQEEEHFCIPIATEAVFEEYWNPIIEELNLKWARWFQGGIEMRKEDLGIALGELDEIRCWLLANKNSERHEQMLERLERLCEQLKMIFEGGRKDIKVYIG